MSVQISTSSILFLLPVFLVGIQSTIFHMPHKLASLFLNEEKVVRVLNSTTWHYQSDEIKRYLLSIEDRIKEVPLLEKDDLEKHSLLDKHLDNLLEKCVSNPVHVYSLLTRLTRQLIAIRLEMEGKQEVKEVATHIDDILKTIEFPTEEDMEGATQNIVRIQFVYKLNPIDLAMGVVGGVTTKARLAGEDCFDIATGRYSGERPIRPSLNKEYALAVEWGEAALELIDEEEEAVIDFINRVKNEHDKYWVSPVGNRGNFPNEEFFVEKFENRNISGKVLRLKEKNLIENQNNSQTQIGGVNIHDFYALCRGEKIRQTKIYMTSNLCKFTTQGNPYFTLSPLKLEILSNEPNIFLFHQILTHNEIKLLKSSSFSKFETSGAGWKKVTNQRTQANSWLWDHQHHGLYQMSLKTEKMTGLNVANKELLDLKVYFEAAEPWQIGIYPAGLPFPTTLLIELALGQLKSGHYFPHYDHIHTLEPGYYVSRGFNNIWLGNRMATVMFYLSQVRGGKTVFPKVGVGVTPEIGSAVFWFNTLHNGQRDHMSIHGSCPTIWGIKLVANKWIREASQLWRRPCRKM